jgi:hypothetical protein
MRVTPGVAFVKGDSVARQGVYMLEVPTEGTVDLTPAHATLPRIDLVVLEDLDSSPDGGGALSDEGRVRVVAGTPNASPTAPATPANALALAEVRVNAGVTTVATSQVTTRAPLLTQPLATAFAFGTSSGTGASGSIFTPASWSSVQQQGGALYDVANGQRFTIPAGQSGLWQVSAQCSWNANAAGTRELYFALNGSVYTGVAHGASPSAGKGTQQSVSLPLDLAEGDYLDLRLAQDSGSAIGYTTSLRIARIGA